MERRAFLRSVALASVFPAVNEEIERGCWTLDRVKDGRIVFLRYDARGEPTASCIIAGKTNDWRVRKAIWGGQIRFSDGFTDRAAAFEEACRWMRRG